MSKPIKTIKQLVKELKKDIRDNEKSLKGFLEDMNYEDYVDLKHDTNTLEYVLDLIEGKV